MSIHSTRKRFPRRARLKKLKLGDQQTRRIMFDAGQKTRDTFWCRSRRGQRCTIGGCGDCATEIAGRASHTLLASVFDKKEQSWIDHEWTIGQTVLDQLADAIPEGTRMCEIELTRFGEGFDTEYQIELVAVDEPEDVEDEHHDAGEHDARR